MITDNGKEQHLNILAGKRERFADIFAVGSSSDQILNSSTDLDFSWGTFPITDSVIDKDNNQVIFYGTIPADLAGEIREIGLMSIDSEIVGSVRPYNHAFYFGESEGWTAVDANGEQAFGFHFDTENSKMGPENVVFQPVRDKDILGLSALDIDVSGMEDIKMRVFCDGGIYANMDIVLVNTGTGAYAMSSVHLNPGENIIKTKIGSGFKSENFDPKSVNSISFIISTPQEMKMEFDSFIICSTKNGGLVMREVVPNPIIKESGTTMEVEMAVGLNV